MSGKIVSYNKTIFKKFKTIEKALYQIIGYE